MRNAGRQPGATQSVILSASFDGGGLGDYMNLDTAKLFEKQSQSSQEQKNERAVWPHIQPWQLRGEGQGRKHRLVCSRMQQVVKTMASFASKSGFCFASRNTLAEKTGLSIGQVDRCLEQLKKQGIVRSTGLSHKHGTRIYSLDPSKLKLAPTKGQSRPTVNSYGLKKGKLYRPAYAPLRESESSTLRESEGSTRANTLGKSFLRRGSGQHRQKSAVGQGVLRTIQLQMCFVEENLLLEERVDPPMKKTTTQGRPKGLTPTPLSQGIPIALIPPSDRFEKNLKSYMNRNGFKPVKEWQQYDESIWDSRDEWIKSIREDRQDWDEACKTIGYSVNYEDPLVCLEFLDVVNDIVEEHSRDAEITRAKICMKILDRLDAGHPKIPFPPSFLKHKTKLARAEKERENSDFFKILD
jgi:hypothetical protein